MKDAVSYRLESMEKTIKTGFVTILLAVLSVLVMQLVVFPFGIKAVAGVLGYDISYWVALGGFVLARLLVTPTNVISGALHKVTRDMEDARKYINKEIK